METSLLISQRTKLPASGTSIGGQADQNDKGATGVHIGLNSEQRFTEGPLMSTHARIVILIVIKCPSNRSFWQPPAIDFKDMHRP